MKTLSSRIKHLRTLLGYDQEALAKAIGVEQESVSKWERGGNMRANTIQAFEDKLHIRKVWLQFGEGDVWMPGYLPPTVVNEQQAEYESFYSEEAIADRFTKILWDYMGKHNLSIKALCEKWDLNETHIGNVLNGRKPVSKNMMITAMSKGDVNLNYVVGNRGKMYATGEAVSPTVDALLKMLQEKDKVILEQARKIEELLTGNAVKKRA